jgi:hypothetical protein
LAEWLPEDRVNHLRILFMDAEVDAGELAQYNEQVRKVSTGAFTREPSLLFDALPYYLINMLYLEKIYVLV